MEKDFEDLIQRGVQDVQDFQEHVQMLSLNNEYFDIDDDIALNMPGLVKMSKKKVGTQRSQVYSYLPLHQIMNYWAQIKVYKILQ